MSEKSTFRLSTSSRLMLMGVAPNDNRRSQRPRFRHRAKQNISALVPTPRDRQGAPGAMAREGVGG
jgi:hypothetical protein